MKTTTLIFTYRGDEYLTPLCVEFIKETMPNTNIVVADDALNAIFSETQKQLKEMGVEYIQTRWPRYGNLLGQKHLMGATKLMSELSKDCDIIVKIDPDACLLKSDWIKRLYHSEEAVFTSAYKDDINYPMGNSYALKASICADLAKDVELYPAWRDSYEDYEIGVRVSRLCNGRPESAIRYTCNIDGGFALTSPYDINIKTCLDRIKVYCSGYQYGSMVGDRKIEYKNKQVEVHTELLKAFKAQNNVMKPIVPKSIENSIQNKYPTPNLEAVSVPDGPAGGNNQYVQQIKFVPPELSKEDVDSLMYITDSSNLIAPNESSDTIIKTPYSSLIS